MTMQNTLHKKFTAISLFSGAVDGLGIAAYVAGFNITHHVEYDEWCCRILRKNFPHSHVIEDDIKNVTTLPTADVLLGSPPCQGWSSAGNGKGEDDPRNLWPDMLRLVQQSRPRCVLVENVRGGISKGYIDLVCGELEAAGYEAQALVYPAAVVGAPHIRERVFIVAHTNGDRSRRSQSEQNARFNQERDMATSEQGRRTELSTTGSDGEDVQHAKRAGLHQSIQADGWTDSTQNQAGMVDGPERSGAVRQPVRLRESRLVGSDDGFAVGVDSVAQNFPGFPNYLGLPQYAYEPPRTIAKKVPHHKDRIAAAGNAVVWWQAYPLMRAIMRYLWSLQ